MRAVAIVFGALVLAGCAKPHVRVLDAGEDKVRVLGEFGATEHDVRVRAAEVCRLYGRYPVRLESSCLDVYCMRHVHLFACRP